LRNIALVDRIADVIEELRRSRRVVRQPCVLTLTV
jgi:hypothetical protein